MGMEPVRPLRDVFAELADHAAGPEDAGSSLPDSRSLPTEYDDLPDDLLVTAINSYAGTAPAEVAEHLAEFVATPGADLANGLDLLATAPAGTWEGEVSLTDPDPAGASGLNDPAGEDSIDGSDGSDDDGDPGLDLDDLDSADSLDRTETSQFEDDNTGSHGLEDDADDTAVDLAGQPPNGSDFGSDDPTAVSTGINDDPEMNDLDDAVVDRTDVDQENLTADGSDPADGHDYLEHRITDHELDDQQPDLDDLNDVQDFDEFDA